MSFRASRAALRVLAGAGSARSLELVVRMNASSWPSIWSRIPAASSRACARYSPCSSLSDMEKELSITTATDVLARPPTALPNPPFRVGLAKARTRHTMASVRRRSRSHCWMRTRCIVVFCSSCRKASELKSIFRGRLKLKRWITSGMAAAIKPNKMRGLRNVITARRPLGHFEEASSQGSQAGLPERGCPFETCNRPSRPPVPIAPLHNGQLICADVLWVGVDRRRDVQCF